MHIVFSIANMPLNAAAIWNGIIIGLGGFLSSHAMRSIFRAIRLCEQSSYKILLKSIPTVAIFALLWTAGIIAVHISIFNFYTLQTMSKAAAFFWFYYYFLALCVWALIYIVSEVFRHRRREAIEKLELEIALRDAQLQNLKWQMNPHFLFNALNSVRALISEDGERAKEMVTRMSVLLRHSLAAGDHKTVPLSQELECALTYLELEKVRFEERLNFHIDCAPECETFPVLPMCLQTLVENGLKHGIGLLPEGGKLSITINMQNSGLLVQIENSGTLKQPLKYGTGLRNTADRIALVFSENSKISLSQKNEDTVLTELFLELKP